MARLFYVFSLAGLIACHPALGQFRDLGPDWVYHKIPEVDCSYGSAATNDLYSPDKLTDGSRRNDATSYQAKTWASCETDSMHWVVINMGEMKLVATVVVWWAFNGFYEDFMAAQEIHFEIEDAGVWVEKHVAAPFQAPVPLPGDPWLYSDSVTVAVWDPVATSKVRLWVPPNKCWTDYNNVLWIAEVEVYGQKAQVATASRGSVVPQSPGFRVTGLDSRGQVRFVFPAARGSSSVLGIFDIRGREVWSYRGVSNGTVTWTPNEAVRGIFVANMEIQGKTTARVFTLH
jgi:hypothetical protein